MACGKSLFPGFRCNESWVQIPVFSQPLPALSVSQRDCRTVGAASGLGSALPRAWAPALNGAAQKRCKRPANKLPSGFSSLASFRVLVGFSGLRKRLGFGVPIFGKYSQDSLHPALQALKPILDCRGLWICRLVGRFRFSQRNFAALNARFDLRRFDFAPSF